MPRLIPREVFIEGPRRPVVVFFTSSLAKFLQAKLVFEALGLHLAYRAHDEDPYHETYEGSKEDLLISAIKELRRRDGTSGSFFFIEDTSIRIEALSNDRDYPGLAAKEWYQSHTFEDLQQELASTDDRRVSVLSSIALAVPGLDRPIFFRGETHGVVADTPAVFEPDPLFPWLSPDNFSAWFVPDGASRPLSEMSFEESLEHDFRVRAMLSMVDRLEEYCCAANAPSSAYARKAALIPTVYGDYVQPQLFPIQTDRAILIVGPPCSGKSTMGMFALENDDLECQVVDASAIVRAKREELGQQDIEISEFARDLLQREGPDVVARMIAQRFAATPHTSTLVVTGFRTIEEVQFFRDSFPNVQVVSVEAPARVRYDRYVRRGTRTSIESYERFKEHDNEQHEFGLLRVASLLADIRVGNVYSREIYYQQCERVLDISSKDAPGITSVSRRMDPETSQLYRCLIVLRKAGRPLTTQEIEADFDRAHHVRYNNANKILKRYPYLARRQESSSSNVRYQITQGGLSFIAAVDWLQPDD
jgi:inosine/xanthosine triphosphate pyrophosphatase family protein/dephospho-CoA kinase